MDTSTSPTENRVPIDTPPVETSGGLVVVETLRSRLWKYFVVGIACVLVIMGSVLYTLKSPREFVPDTVVTISNGMTFRQAGQLLQEKKIIKSAGLMQVCAQIISANESVIAGEYVFEKPQNACSIGYRVTRGLFGTTRIKITIPEGSTNRDIADILAKKIPNINVDEFIAKAKDREGYLFPETYFFFKTSSVDQIIDRLQNEYTQQVTPLYPDMKGTNRSESDIIIVASILEREAKNKDEAKIIAGIMYRRMQIGMPLQVDATFLYSVGKGSSELTLNDLRTDSPWNTYTRTGLPPGPIGNPGMDMIYAAIHPEMSRYLYYLHDRNGQIHYAITHDEHVRNKQKFLK